MPSRWRNQILTEASKDPLHILHQEMLILATAGHMTSSLDSLGEPGNGRIEGRSEAQATKSTEEIVADPSRAHAGGQQLLRAHAPGFADAGDGSLLALDYQPMALAGMIPLLMGIVVHLEPS
jgi:hypothetical protein